jgi:ribosomal protein S18 acetylase RimI-like enzyme
MSIDIIETSDAHVIAPLIESVQNEHHERRPDWFKPYDRSTAVEGMQEMLEQPGKRCLVALVDDVAAGYALLTETERAESLVRHADRTLSIEQMSVDPEFRRQGVATALVNRIREIARDAKFDRISLTVWSDNKNARAFYDALGFSSIREAMELKL